MRWTLLSTRATAIERLLAAERRRLLRSVVLELPFELRSVLFQHDLYEISMRDIAATRGIPVSTVYKSARCTNGAPERSIARRKGSRGASLRRRSPTLAPAGEAAEACLAGGRLSGPAEPGPVAGGQLGSGSAARVVANRPSCPHLREVWVTRPRKGATSPPAATHPRKRPTIGAILAERSVIVAVLIASGVPSRDRADVEQQVLMGAWNSVRRACTGRTPQTTPTRRSGSGSTASHGARRGTTSLAAQMEARTRAEREAVADARGALQILDAIERHFVRRDE
ncbi:RNA polymerase sigma factor [Sorangium sp. So ce590]|uniref:RNA polymerase sigma factor n=1 Tax=unclassified Sorangium TaxID=2621164 RepID=UPI003F6404F2